MHCAHTRCSSAVTAVSRRPGGQNNNKKKKERKIKYNNIIIPKPPRPVAGRVR